MRDRVYRFLSVLFLGMAVVFCILAYHEHKPFLDAKISHTFEIVIIALAIAIAGRITSGISIFTSDSAIFNTFDGFAQALNSMIYMILMAVSVKGAPTFLNKTFNL